MIGADLVLAAGGLALAGLALACFALLKAWHGWLELKRLEIAEGRPGRQAPGGPGRIELADLKERVRKLESIASGIDP